MAPKVSICLPTYNRALTLLQTIEAVLAQTFSDWELIVCDDSSSDNTAEVVRSFKDGRIRYCRNEANLGLYPNWNRCIGLASGEYVAIYHDHDIYLPMIVERSVALLERHPTASFVHTALLRIDDGNVPAMVDIRPFPELMPGKEMMRLLPNGWASPVMAPTAMVRREAYECVGLYDFEGYRLGCDMDMWFRLSRIGDVAYVGEPQVLIRTRKKGQWTARFRWADVKGSLQMRRDHIEQAFGVDEARRLEYCFSKAKYIVQRDIRLAVFMIRAILLEPPEVVDEGEAVTCAEASRWVRLTARLVKGNTVLKTLLRSLILPIYYRRMSRWIETHRQEAITYVRANRYLLDYLPGLDLEQLQD